MYIGVGVPSIKRFDLVRSDYLVMGPGLPQLTDAEKALVPADIMAQVKDIPHSSTFGMMLERSPDDQSTCAHLCDEMKKHSKPRHGRCDFYEPFGDGHSWRLVEGDKVYGPTVGSTYYVAVWLRPFTSAKFGVAIGTWKEDFYTKYDKTAPSKCAAVTKDYEEKEMLAKDDPVKMEVCKAPATGITWKEQWTGPDECGAAGTKSAKCPDSGKAMTGGNVGSSGGDMTAATTIAPTDGAVSASNVARTLQAWIIVSIATLALVLQ